MEAYHERKDIIYIIGYWYDQSGSSEQYTIPLDNSAQRDKTTEHQYCSLWGKLNSRKQKCGNQIFKLDETRSAVYKGASPSKGCLFPEIYIAWNRDFQQFFMISHSNVFLNFGLKVCRRDKCIALCLANCNPAKCFVHADKCCCTVR